MPLEVQSPTDSRRLIHQSHPLSRREPHLRPKNSFLPCSQRRPNLRTHIGNISDILRGAPGLFASSSDFPAVPSNYTSACHTYVCPRFLGFLLPHPHLLAQVKATNFGTCAKCEATHLLPRFVSPHKSHARIVSSLLQLLSHSFQCFSPLPVAILLSPHIRSPVIRHQLVANGDGILKHLRHPTPPSYHTLYIGPSKPIQHLLKLSYRCHSRRVLCMVLAHWDARAAQLWEPASLSRHILYTRTSMAH